MAMPAGMGRPGPSRNVRMNTTTESSTMKIRSRSTSSAILASAIAATLLIAGSATAAPSAAASAKAKAVFSNRGPAANVELPSHAKANSGTSGALDTSALDASTLNLTLADGRVIEARLQRVSKDDKASRKSWVGTVDSMPGSMLVLTKYRGVTTGFLTLGSETWELMPTKGGKHLLYQVDEQQAAASRAIAVSRRLRAGLAAGASDYGTSGASTDADGGYVHDLLVVYTPAARSAYGQATLESMIQNAVAAANQAYQNSNVQVTAQPRRPAGDRLHGNRGDAHLGLRPERHCRRPDGRRTQAARQRRCRHRHVDIAGQRRLRNRPDRCAPKP